jgi:hypothetical protein
MLNNIVGNDNRRGCTVTATAITVALTLILIASLAILTTTITQAYAAPLKSNNDCNEMEFRSFRSNSFYSTQVDNGVTIVTPQHEYPVKIDYFRDSGDEVIYFKNVGAEDPEGPVLIPGGENITITLQTNEPISGYYYGYRTHVTLYNDKVCDCQILLSGAVKDTDKMDLKIVSIEQSNNSPIVKLTVQVPDASDIVGKNFTKLGVQFPYSPEGQEYYLISNGVHVK